MVKFRPPQLRFNSTNLQDTSNEINTIQNINTAASPTFASMNLVQTAADPYLNFRVTAGGQWTFGIDDTDSDTLKITDGANPSAGNERLAVLPAGNVRFNNAFTFPITDGSSGQVLKTNGAGTVTWQTDTGGGGTVLAWALMQLSGGGPNYTIVAGYNVASFNSPGGLDNALVFTTALASANYAAFVQQEISGAAPGPTHPYVLAGTRTVNGFTVRFSNTRQVADFVFITVIG